MLRPFKYSCAPPFSTTLPSFITIIRWLRAPTALRLWLINKPQKKSSQLLRKRFMWGLKMTKKVIHTSEANSTPYEFTLKTWQNTPEKFITDPNHHNLELYI